MKGSFWQWCKRRDLHWCKGRCDEPRGSDVRPRTAPAVERGAEAGDRCGGICAWRIGERCGAAHGYCSWSDLSLAAGFSEYCGGVCRGGGVAVAARDVGG